ncbi:MAG: imidazole glycerol phosphate synthase subunit HisH [Chloroflexi bacterium]|nr:imidazole glycerol phosphate synthase subunit HisH [Chloroflexota bacterium]
MTTPQIAIIDYGAGNLRSVAKAYERLGYTPRIITSASDVLKADVVILPGVGAASDTMSNLRRMGLVKPIKEFISQGKPFFGVCMGMQILFSTSEEGEEECLGVVPGRVRKLPESLKVPHMGWNQLEQVIAHPIFDGIPNRAHFYFVHSYYCEPLSSSVAAAVTEYSIPFCSLLVQGNLVGTQFHPEKSGELGLKLYDNFIRFTMGTSLWR